MSLFYSISHCGQDFGKMAVLLDYATGNVSHVDIHPHDNPYNYCGVREEECRIIPFQAEVVSSDEWEKLAAQLHPLALRVASGYLSGEGGSLDEDASEALETLSNVVREFKSDWSLWDAKSWLHETTIETMARSKWGENGPFILLDITDPARMITVMTSDDELCDIADDITLLAFQDHVRLEGLEEHLHKLRQRCIDCQAEAMETETEGEAE